MPVYSFSKQSEYPQGISNNEYRISNIEYRSEKKESEKKESERKESERKEREKKEREKKERSKKDRVKRREGKREKNTGKCNPTRKACSTFLTFSGEKVYNHNASYYRCCFKDSFFQIQPIKYPIGAW
jgi:hypothetical protein